MNARRQTYSREMAQLLGGTFSVEDDVVITHPRNLGSALEDLVAGHEAVHKLLTMGTLFGYFQRALVTLQDEAEDQATLRTIAAKLVNLARQIHEGTASYVELCMCEAKGLDVQAHLGSFPDDYVAALDPILKTLGLPEHATGPYQWLAAVHIAKVALNMPIVDELGAPQKLTPERLEAFAAIHGPDVRLAQLLSTLRDLGGLSYIVPRYSIEIEKHWAALVPDNPAPRTHWAGDDIFDLRTAVGHPDAGNITDYAELALLHIIAGAAPEMGVVLGPEATKMAMLSLMRAWSSQSESMRRAADRVEIAGPLDELGLRHRSYHVRVRIDEELPVRRLDDLRTFLTEQAALGLRTFAGFVETTNAKVAIYAVTTDGLDAADAIEGSGRINFRDSWLAVLPPADYNNFVLLRSANETYGDQTAWHVPLEVLQQHDMSNIELGLHGAVMRTIPSFDEELLLVVAEQVVKAGAVVKIRPLTTTDLPMQVIVLELLLDQVPLHLRAVGSPSFIACLGTVREARLFYDRLDDQTRRHVIWAGGEETPHANILWMLLQMGYNFDDVGSMFLGVRLVPA